MGRLARADDGFTLIEVLLAVTLMAVGIGATLNVYNGSSRSALAAQRVAVASQQAQKELDRISKMSYETIGMTSTPPSSASPLNPGSRVSGTSFTVRPGVTETFVLSTDAGQSAAAISPTPTSFAVGVSGETITGELYRYVTWRDESCASGCAGNKDTKRVTVAVTIDAVGSLAARVPVFLSQVIPNPQAIAPGNSVPPPLAGTSTLTAQDFYLYDTRCGSNTRQAQSGSHSTHDSASWGPPTSSYSVCENTSASGTLQPDLMGADVPPGDSSTPLYTYSTDFAGTYDGGLAMKGVGTSCRSNFAAATANPGMYSVHAWSTPTFASGFTVQNQATVSIFTSTVGGAAARGVVCATLIDRSVASGVPTDTVLGSTTYDLASWPTDGRRVSFSFNVTTTTIAANHRLVLVLNVRSESGSDLVFLYDHPLNASFLEVATTTPL